MLANCLGPSRTIGWLFHGLQGTIRVLKLYDGTTSVCAINGGIIGSYVSLSFGCAAGNRVSLCHGKRAVSLSTAQSIVK